MSALLPRPRLAVLIDAENVSHRLAPRIFALVEPLGVVRVRRYYGDFAGQARSWDEAAARHALESRHCVATSKGKNGADIALTVEAMDLLRDGETDGFCIVSSDGDFAALARRIRGDGRSAFGLGCASAPQRYRIACTEFIHLDPEKVAKPAASTEPTHKALPSIRAALAKCPQRDGWYWLAEFGTHARRAGLAPKTYGAASLSRLLRATGQFTFDNAGRFQPATVLRAVGQ